MEEERSVFARLAVFAGGWTLDAAEQVCAGGAIDASMVLDVLSRLVDKSLVVVEHGAQPERRYRLLETIRQYARDRLVQSGDIDDAAARHFSYFLSLARRAEPELGHRDQGVWLTRLDADHDNLRAAIDWGIAEPAQKADALALASSLWWFWVKRGYFREGWQRLTHAIEANPDVAPGVEARALVGVVHYLSFLGEKDEMREVNARCLRLAREAQDVWTESFALAMGAVQESDAGHFERSVALALEAREVARRCTDPAIVPSALALRMLAYGALQAGDLERAGRLFDEAVAILRPSQNSWSLAILLGDLAGLRILEARYAEAAALAVESLGYSRDIRDRRGIGWCLQTIAMKEAAAGRARLAASLCGAAATALESVGSPPQITVARVQDRCLALAREALGDAVFQEAFEAGRALALEDAMNLAIAPHT